MKSILNFFKTKVTVPHLTKFFILGNLSLSYLDSSVFFFNIYNFSLHFWGVIFFLLSYYCLIYWMKALKLTINIQDFKFYVYILKILLLFILVLPLLMEFLKVPDFFSFSSKNLILYIFELVKIIFIELLLEIYFKILNGFNYKD